jgi:uncharacterized tellurite resistance protein B-like protein
MSQLSVTQELMVAAAWADGRLHDQEAAFLRRVLANGSVSADEIERRLEKPSVNLPQVLARLSVGADRYEVLGELLRLCAADGQTSSWEEMLIGKVAEHLGIPGEQVEQMKLAAGGRT